ncbi:MAG: ATPase V [Erysipelotrichaceae bacterium]|jgi:V/A-type H+-transporting ATPase subunit I|nr:ATPase V [Erysipelotrichaceae bacterium]
MAIVKMKFVSASTDQEHLDDMIYAGIHSDMLHAEQGSAIVNEENQGKLINEENPWAGYEQTLKNFAHGVNYDIKKKEHADHVYSQEETENFLKELNDKFGVTSDADQVVLTPDDEAALAALSELDFKKIHECQYLNFEFGRLPRESFKKLAMYREEIFVHHKLHETPQYIWMVIVSSDSYADKVHKIFKDLFFEPMEIPSVDIHQLLESYGEKIDDVYTYVSNQNEIHNLYPYIAILNDQYTLNGFVKADDVETYEKKFAAQVSFDVQEPSAEPALTCPTELKNNWFVRPFELFLGMYGMPAYNDFDPTGFMAVTYCLLFGIMFGDLGQGIVLALIGFLFEKKGKLFGIIGRVGITSSIFGFLFGSVFGYEDLLNPIHQSLFGVREKLFDVMATSSTMVLLIGAIAIGAVLILTTQCINIWNRFRHHEIGEAVFSQNGIAGFVFYGGILAAVISQMLFGVSLLNPIFYIVCIGLPLFCFLMKEPLSAAAEHRPIKPREGWGGYITMSIFELLDVLLTFITNSMSYLRVGGFVLSHAGMMLVVMTLVKMTGGAGPVVLVLGNLFVMGLEGLIVGIQTLRLEYYEMFSRYYDAGGTKFTALTAESAE